MSKPISLAEHKLKKRAAELKEAVWFTESPPVTLEYMEEFRAEMRGEFAKIHAQFDRMKSKWKRQDLKMSLVPSDD